MDVKCMVAACSIPSYVYSRGWWNRNYPLRNTAYHKNGYLIRRAHRYHFFLVVPEPGRKKKKECCNYPLGVRQI